MLCTWWALSKNPLLKRCNTAQKIRVVLLPGNHWSIKELTWSVMNAMAEKSLTSDWEIILIPPLFFFFQFTSEDSTLCEKAKRQTCEAFLKYQCQQTFLLAGNLSYIITHSSWVIETQSNLASRVIFNSALKMTFRREFLHRNASSSQGVNATEGQA